MTDQLAAPGVDEVDDESSGAAATSTADATDTTDATDGENIAAASPVTRGRFGRVPKAQRISKWDRPPDPHDWRFFVGNLGKVLIATGLLLFGFVGYQLWGTGIETARAQNRLENEFDAILAEYADGQVDLPAPSDGLESTDGADDDFDETSGAPPAAGDGAADGQAADPSDDTGTVDATDSDDGLGIVTGESSRAVPVAVDLSDQAVVQAPLPKPFRGDALFRLEIPAIDREDIVVAGVSLDDLKDGPGHYDDTPLPGQLGNASIAGHRTTYGAPFHNVDKLLAGDEIITTLANGDRFVYEVTFVEVVAASDYWVVTTRDPNIAELTLTSCHPKYTARDRIVVHSVLNPEKSSNVGLPTFYELEPDESVIPGDDPTFDANGIEVTEQDTAGVEVDESADPSDTPVEVTDNGAAEQASPTPDDEVRSAPSADTSGQLVAGATPAPSIDAPIDAFSQGWFDDRAAFFQIALWGIALTIISLLAYQVSKRFRRDSIGLLVGIAPFLFALYFFFQNVNRLLPPGI